MWPQIRWRWGAHLSGYCGTTLITGTYFSGLIAFFRNTEKPDFTEDECNVLFTHISILTRYRYYTGVRNEQRKAEEKMMRDMHLVLQLKESATEEFLHHTLMLVKNLTDADRSSSFLVNTLSESLRAEQQLIPHHLGTGAIDPISGRPSYRRGHDIRYVQLYISETKYNKQL